jgi:hypothetical protein
MLLSKYKLQVGALLVSVNGDNSYNPDQIGTYCRKRPLRLEFSQPAYQAFDVTLRNALDENRNITAIFTNDDIQQARKRIHSPQGRSQYLNVGGLINKLSIRQNVSEYQLALRSWVCPQQQHLT